MNKWDITILICFLLLAGTCFYLIHKNIVLTKDYNRLHTSFNRMINKSKCESCKMYDPKVEWGLDGVYHPPEFYCVWVKDKTEKEINNTVCHELCHHFIQIDKEEHFCKK